VVDDKEDARCLAGKILRIHGCEVIGAGTGEEAINMSKNVELILFQFIPIQFSYG